MTNHNDTYSTVRFGDVAREVTESTRTPLKDGFERYIGLEHLDPESLKIRRWGLIEEDNPTFTRIFRAGQVLFGRRRAYQRKAALAEFDGICSGDILVMEAKPDKMLPELLPFIVQTEGFYEHALSTSAGSLSPRTKWSALAKYEFPLPPLDEQRRIAEILWAVEEALEKHLLAFDALWQSKQIIMNNLFPDPRRIETKHPTAKLEDICEMQEGRVFPSSDYSDEGIKLLRPGNLAANGYLEWSKAATKYLPLEYLEKYPDYLVEPCDIVINLTAQSLEDGFMGRVCKAQADDYCLLNQRLGRFICYDDLHPDFLFRYLQTSYFRRHAEAHCEGSKIKHLYWRHLRDFCLETPPLHVQEQKIQITQELDDSVIQLKTHIRHLKSLRILLRETLLIRGKSKSPLSEDSGLQQFAKDGLL